MRSGAALLVWFSFALILIVQPAAAWAMSMDINQLSLFLWSPGVNTGINGTSALQQDIIIGPNNLSGGPFADFVAQGFNVSVTNNLNSNNYGSIGVTITNPGGPLLTPVNLIALLDADIVSNSGGTDNNLDRSGPGTNHGSATAFQVDDPISGTLINNILAGTLDNTDHIGSAGGDVAFGLLYALSSFGVGDQINATLLISSTDNGGLHQFRNSTELFFNADVTLTHVGDGGPAPTATPEPMSLVLLGTGAGLAVLRRVRRAPEAAL